MQTLDKYEDATIKRIEVGPDWSYEPTYVDIHFVDGRYLRIDANSIMYDQYSSTPCIQVKEGTI